MIRVIPYKEQHLWGFRPIQQPQTPEISREEMRADFEAKRQREDVWTFCLGETVLAIGGVNFPWGNRMAVWVVLDECVKPHMLALTRFLTRFIDGYHCPRVEMHVCAGFANGAKWARMLGFTNETPEPLRKFFPDGSDAYMFARIV